MSKFVTKYPHPPRPVRRVPAPRPHILGPLEKALLSLNPPVIHPDGTREEDSIPYHAKTPQGGYQGRARLIETEKVVASEFVIAIHPDHTGEARWRIWRTK